jgi:phosphoserine phosphatase RsbU/P
MVFGLFSDQSYAPGCIELRPGERVLVFSDGVTEAASAAGDMFGDERLAATILEGASLDIDALTARVVEEVDRFVGAPPQQDGITAIAAEVA